MCVCVFVRARVCDRSARRAGVSCRVYIWCFAGYRARHAATSRTGIVQDVRIKGRSIIVETWSWATEFTPRSGSRKRGKSGLVSWPAASRWRHQAESSARRSRPLCLSRLPPYLSPPVAPFSFFLSCADSRLRAAAAASSATLASSAISDIMHRQVYRPFPSSLPGAQCRSRRVLVESREHARTIDRCRSTHRFCHRRDYRFAPVNETAIPRPVTLRHR